MPTLREYAKAYTGKKELYDLPKVSVDLDVKDAEFEQNGKKIPYKYVEIDGYKYTIKANQIQQIQTLLGMNADLKFVKFQKAPNGDVFIMPAA